MELIVRMNLQGGAPECNANNTDSDQSRIKLGSSPPALGKYSYLHACIRGVCIPADLCNNPEG